MDFLLRDSLRLHSTHLAKLPTSLIGVIRMGDFDSISRIQTYAAASGVTADVINYLAIHRDAAVSA